MPAGRVPEVPKCCTNVGILLIVVQNPVDGEPLSVEGEAFGPRDHHVCSRRSGHREFGYARAIAGFRDRTDPGICLQR